MLNEDVFCFWKQCKVIPAGLAGKALDWGSKAWVDPEGVGE